ncbi:MAG: two component transcriptional regulator, LytTR family [Rariglobus sp.]|jgi:two-component system LytT family response regulator|nr:two component transcriptional regulator, LytTR family [Rariglobus sp.]
MLRALLIDDEPPARDLLRRLLAPHAADVEIVGEARSVADAAEKCARLRPGLLFLDVQMPREDGFALLPLLTPPLPVIIFVTAYDHFAVRAFEVNALDYLLKPVAPERLARALARAAAASPPAPPAGAPLQPGDVIFLRSDQNVRSAPVTALTHIEAEENYTRVHLADAPPLLLRRTMSEWEALLPPSLFVRVERSLFVNLTAVRELEIVSRDVARLHLAGRRDPLVLARRASLRLRRLLHR